MRILNGSTNEQVGQIDTLGYITTDNTNLRALMQEIESKGFVALLNRSISSEAGISDEVAIVPKDSSDYPMALAIILQRNGFLVVS